MKRACSCYNLPHPLPPLNIFEHRNNYLLLRSFHTNWTKNHLVHTICPRPAFSVLAGGEQYFEWRLHGAPTPIATVCFLAIPAIDSDSPFCTRNISNRHGGLSTFIFSRTILDYLPAWVEDQLLSHGNQYNVSLADFGYTLDPFLEDYHCPLSPSILPSITIPLENQQ